MRALLLEFSESSELAGQPLLPASWGGQRPPVPPRRAPPEARHLPMSVPRRFPWLKPNSQAKVSQHGREVTLQQYILALKVPVETMD